MRPLGYGHSDHSSKNCASVFINLLMKWTAATGRIGSLHVAGLNTLGLICPAEIFMRKSLTLN